MVMQSFCTLLAATKEHSSTSFAFGKKIRTLSQINAS